MASEKRGGEPLNGESSSADADAAAESPGFEQALAALEKIVSELESGQLSLSEAIRRYEHGVKMLRHCHAQLQHAEQKISLLTKVEADGSFESTPFEGETPRPGKRGSAAPRRKPSKARPEQETGETPDSSARDNDDLLF
jgi:exodeoxyribonuclease VII small subunit